MFILGEMIVGGGVLWKRHSCKGGLGYAGRATFAFVGHGIVYRGLLWGLCCSG